MTWEKYNTNPIRTDIFDSREFDFIINNKLFFQKVLFKKIVKLLKSIFKSVLSSLWGR